MTKHYTERLIENQHNVFLFGDIDSESVQDVYEKLNFLNKFIRIQQLSIEHDGILNELNDNLDESPRPEYTGIDIKNLDRMEEIDKLLLPDNVIKLHISSRGGDMNDALSIIDFINASEFPVQVIGTGRVMSAAPFILMSGTKGYRCCTANTRFLLHPTSSCSMGTIEEQKVQLNETKKLNKIFKSIAMKRTKLTSEEYDAMDVAGDHYFGAKKALEYGIIDYII